MKLKRLGVILLSCIVVISILLSGTALAAEEELPLSDPGTTPPVEGEELPLPDPGITPDSPFYGIDRFFEGMHEFFTFNSQAKARLHVAFAAERVAEIKIMLETKGVEAKGLDVAEAHLEAHVAKAVDIIENEKEKGSDVSALVHEILGDFHEQRQAVKEAFGEAKDEFLGEKKALQEQLRAANKDGDAALQERIRQELAVIEAGKDAAEAEKDEAIAALEAERNRLRVRMEGELEDEEERESRLEIEGAEVEVEGAIVRVTDTELVLVVDGQEVVITLDALTDIEGDLVEGAWVEVEAVAEDGLFLAIEIEVEAEDEDEDLIMLGRLIMLGHLTMLDHLIMLAITITIAIRTEMDNEFIDSTFGG